MNYLRLNLSQNNNNNYYNNRICRNNLNTNPNNSNNSFKSQLIHCKNNNKLIVPIQILQIVV